MPEGREWEMMASRINDIALVTGLIPTSYWSVYIRYTIPKSSISFK
jgi:hypothetical protein